MKLMFLGSWAWSFCFCAWAILSNNEASSMANFEWVKRQNNEGGMCWMEKNVEEWTSN
jgi:hypothetical protein